MNSWFKEIDRATTEAQVVASARDFLSLLHPRELEPLPKDCRQISIESVTDIDRWSGKLARECAAVHERSPEVEKLRDVVNYLSRARERIGEIRKAQ